MRMPGIVEADATIPMRSEGVPRLSAKGLRTGFFDIVELKMANKPIMQSAENEFLKVTVVLFERLSKAGAPCAGILANRGQLHRNVLGTHSMQCDRHCSVIGACSKAFAGTD